MTTQKDFKRLVRGRMQKTGESYTTARASLLTQGATRNGAAAETNGHSALAPALSPRKGVVPAENGPTQSKAQPVDFAKLAGMAK